MKEEEHPGQERPIAEKVCEEEEPDLVYPLEEEDLLRRVTGEVLRFREAQGELSDVEAVVSAVRRIAAEVREVMKLRRLPLRRIDLTEMTRRHLCVEK